MACLLGLLCLFLVASCVVGVFINEKVPSRVLPVISGKPAQLQNKAAASLVADFDSGQIIAEKNPNQNLAIASTSKLLTAYLVYQAVQQKKLSWQQRIKVTPQIQALSRNSELMNIPLQAGQAYTVKELLDATLLISSNATGILLGDAISGNQRNFADLMNRTTASFGIPSSQYHFYNAVGINNVYLSGQDKIPKALDNDENVASAKALTTIANRLFKKYPKVIKEMQSPELFFPFPASDYAFRGDSVLTRFNKQFPQDAKVFSIVKSGASEAAGSVLLALTNKMPNGRRYIVLTMHASDYTNLWPTWDLTAKTATQVSRQGSYLSIPKNTQISGAENLYLQKTSPSRIALQNASSINFWTSGKRKQVSANHIAYDRRSANIAKDSILVTRINNLRDFDYLYGQKPVGKLYLKTMRSAVWQLNPFVRYWRWLTH